MPVLRLGYGPDDPGFDSDVDKGLFSKQIQTDNGGYPAYYSTGTAFFSQGVHRPWQEINRSPPTHSEDKNE